VPTDHRDQVAELLADYQRSREQLASVQRNLQSITETATTPDGLISARVGARGTLTDLRIGEAAYQRYRSHALAATVLRVVGEATARAAERTNQTLAPVLPADADPAAVLAGSADLRAEEIAPVPAAPVAAAVRKRAARAVDDDEDYEQHSWLHDDTGRGRQS
jgi:DNA-binding protein YbaB